MSKHVGTVNGELLRDMARAAELWAIQGKSTELERWIDREIDGDSMGAALAEISN